MEVVVYLTNKYQDNPYMSKKLENYLENLPQVMQGIEEDYVERARLKREAVERRDNYLEWFVTHYSFFYHPSSEQYFKYTRNSFVSVSEDELMQTITRSLHIDFELHRGKQQMKRRMMRQVKCNLLFRATPSTAFVDTVLRYFQTYFSSQLKTRYFLTCVGDLLLGKRNLNFFMDPSFKHFVQMVAQGLHLGVNKHIADNFKFKYYDHDYTKSRIIPGTCASASHRAHRIQYVDVAVVATYFSNRFGSSDGYLSHCEDPAFEQQVMILQANPSPAVLVNTFLQELTVPDGVMLYKNLYFVWKFFLFKKTLPFVVSQQNFKQILAAQGVYDPATDSCKVQSRFALSVLNFELFWAQCMVKDPNASYTVEEIEGLYHDWGETKQHAITLEECKEWLDTSHIDDMVGDVVHGYKCHLWDKTIDIENAIEAHTGMGQDLYTFYCEYTLAHSKRIVTQEYFNNYVETR